MSSSSDPALTTNQLPISVEMPSEFEKFREIISLLYKRIANSSNSKTGGLYSLQESYNSNQYYDITNTQTFRSAYRKVFDLVALNGGNIAGGATVSFPHGITGLKYSALIYASCTSVTPEFFTVVYPNAKMDAINLVFTNPLPATALSSVILVAEVLKA